MKLLMVLGELLLLLVSLMWTCSGQQPVLLECSHFYFRATVKRALFYENELVGPDELFLGTGCPATQVRPYELKFDYPLNLCGIVKQVFFDRVVIHSWLTYTPRNRSFSAELHLQCMVPSTYVVRDNNVMSMPDENWFLIQNRYCAMCRSAHFRDNWSTPFYRPRNHSLQRPFNPPSHHHNFRSLCPWTLPSNIKYPPS